MNYLALTIGPIVETLNESKKTKELFAESYLFSYFMKNVLQDLKKAEYRLIVPYHQDIEKLFAAKDGVGMFHDRLIVSSDKSKEDIEKDINTFIEETINKITNGIIQREANNRKHADLIKAFFKRYLQISYLITDKNFSLKGLMNQLDVMELHREFTVSPDDYKVLYDQNNTKENKPQKINPLVFIQRKFHNSFLSHDAFGENITTDFPSVLDIALANDENIEYTYDEEQDKKLEEVALKGVKNHKKYMALIQGDGDKIGAILKNMDTDPEKIRLFSEKLLDFTLQIPAVAHKYKAKVVYAGGDDMLAFAPIITDDKKTVFDFLLELDAVFKETMKELNIEEANSVSQSFGVSLVYYKKPLYQALHKAINNLFYVAKADDNMRNRAVVELIKHSGQTYTSDMILTSNTYKYFNKLLVQELGEDNALPHAITHNLMRSKVTLKSIADEYKDEEFLSMIDNFFKNNFNKETHAQENTDKAIELAKNLLTEHLLVYQNSGNSEAKNFEHHMKHFVTILSTIKHLRGDR